MKQCVYVLSSVTITKETLKIFYLFIVLGTLAFSFSSYAIYYIYPTLLIQGIINSSGAKSVHRLFPFVVSF